MSAEIVVIGSINHDLTVVTERLPRPGETMLGSHHYWGGGGKGANQAVAATRMGARVAMVGRVGDDDQGKALRQALAEEGVDVAPVSIDPDTPSGMAIITVDGEAENTIVVSPSANGRLLPEHLDRVAIAEATVVLAQLEIPIDTVTAAAGASRGLFVLNPAPGQVLPDELLRAVDVLVPNRSELAALAGGAEPESLDEAVRMAQSLSHGGSTVVTLGSRGALVVVDGAATHIPTIEVDAIDPTGAGDAFCGALAHGLSRDMDLVEAVEIGVVAGALATTKAGARDAMPTRQEVEAHLHR